MDVLSILGLLLGVAAILLGQHLEGGQLATLLNGPALLIVLGGTIGAVMVQTPMHTFLRALRMVAWTFYPPRIDFTETIQQIISWSRTARREGLLGLENIAQEDIDGFAQKGLQLLVDGSEPESIRRVLDIEIDSREKFDQRGAKVFESMGGYSPTLGIIGAVLGLIQVMGNLSDPGKLGDGIAVAFVATIYGVGAANLLFLPVANKLKTYAMNFTLHRELILEGIVSIAEGENPRSIEAKLLGYLYLR